MFNFTDPHWKKQIGNFNNRPLFSRCTVFLDFSIMSLFKLFIKFSYCIISIASMLLHLFCQRIYTVITLCKSVICIFNCHVLYLSLDAKYICQVWLYELHISLSGDIELNPVLESNSCENFLVCHWNLNSISDHNFSEVSLLNAYTSVNSFDMICFSDTCLDSRTLSQGRNQEFQGYDLISADHPSNVKRDGACIYYQNHLC